MRVKMAVIVLCALPCIALAQSDPQSQIESLLQQIAALQRQLTASSASTAPVPAAGAAAPSLLSCPVFSRTLQRGSEGADVRELQAILKSGGYLSVEPTGYFGALTEKALQDFQAKAKLVSDGTPVTTGWGVFGPKTRAFIAKLCADELAGRTAGAQEPCPAAPAQPASACPGTWQKLTDARQCITGWQCVGAPSPNSHNAPPRVSRIDGPTTLGVRQSGLWSVLADDPENGSLAYSVTWGDEDPSSLLSILAGNSPVSFSASSRFTHYFTRVGQFAPTFSVRDGAGNITSSTLSISVLASSTTLSAIGGTPTTTQSTPTPNSCLYAGAYYPEGTETEGYSAGDLCVASGGICETRTAYLPKFKCVQGAWASALVNPYPNLPSYGNVVGSACSSNNASLQVVVAPNTQICRALLCAVSQNYAAITLNCQYTNWVDWGVFQNAATTTSICSGATPCEYSFGGGGRACAAKQNGVCPTPTNSNNPLHY